MFPSGPSGNIVSLMKMLVTDLVTELILLCVAVWRASLHAGLLPALCTEGGWGKSELFNFKCYNKKANVVETKEMSI